MLPQSLDFLLIVPGEQFLLLYSQSLPPGSSSDVWGLKGKKCLSLGGNAGLRAPDDCLLCIRYLFFMYFDLFHPFSNSTDVPQVPRFVQYGGE